MIGDCKYDVIETGQKYCNSVELAEESLNIKPTFEMMW
jgi:hypothetical protein